MHASLSRSLSLSAHAQIHTAWTARLVRCPTVPCRKAPYETIYRKTRHHARAEAPPPPTHTDEARLPAHAQARRGSKPRAPSQTAARRPLASASPRAARADAAERERGTRGRAPGSRRGGPPPAFRPSPQHSPSSSWPHLRESTRQAWAEVQRAARCACDRAAPCHATMHYPMPQ
jgi:hypothetical protein